jgi:hypothetical protein
MRFQRHLGNVLLAGFVALGLGCDGTMSTGTAKRPVNNKPAADGTCPTGDSLCGTGVFAICVDLQNDPAHCGSCDRACAPGIACQAGVCQQTLCTGTSVPFSGQPTTAPDGGAPFPFGPQGRVTMTDQILADVNGDGRVDLIQSSFGYETERQGGCSDCTIDPGEFRVSLGQPGGTFAPSDTYHAKAAIQRYFTTDVNNDGMADLYIISSNYSNGTTAHWEVELWLGQKDGHLRRADSAGMSTEGMSGSGYEIAVEDLSGDGWPDLVMEAADPDVEAVPKISIYLSDSMGALHLSQTFVAWAGRTFVRDMDGNGSPDLVLLWNTMEILYNRGDGTFEPPINCGLAIGLGAWGSADIVMEDFNRDGWADLATGENRLPADRIAVMLGLGRCAFTPVSYYDVPGTSLGYLFAADLNGDGVLDLVSTSAVSGKNPNDPTGLSYITTDTLLGVLLGNPDGTFRPSGTGVSLGTDWVSSISIGEVSGDGRPDIVVSNAIPSDSTSPKISTWENTCQ